MEEEERRRRNFFSYSTSPKQVYKVKMHNYRMESRQEEIKTRKDDNNPKVINIKRAQTREYPN